MKKIAYFDAAHDLPEEVISAAGFVPYRLFGDVQKPNDPADRYLSAFFCPVARSILTEALEFSGDWDGIVIAQGCSSTNRHYDVWKLHVKTPFLYWFNGPLKDDSLALRFLKNEIRKFLHEIEREFGLKITDEKLAAAIQDSNRLKKLLSEISLLRSEKDIPNREYLALLVKVMRMPRNEAVSEAAERLEDFKTRDVFPADKTKVILTGSDITYPGFMDLLDESGFRAVRDDLSVGERYYAGLIDEESDPVDSLARYYIGIPKPATRPGIKERVGYLLKAMDEAGLDAVVSQNMKFCEPYAYDSVVVNSALRDQGYKVIHVEREYTPNPDRQLLTRLAAFSEIL